MFTGHYVESSTWFDRLLALPAAATTAATRSTALSYAGQLRLMLGAALAELERVGLAVDVQRIAPEMVARNGLRQASHRGRLPH